MFFFALLILRFDYCRHYLRRLFFRPSFAMINIFSDNDSGEVASRLPWLI